MRGSNILHTPSASAVYSNTSPPHRIKVSKRSEKQSSLHEMQKSSNLAEMLQHEKAVSQDYKERNERNIVKCRFLYNKLTALGNLEGVPEMIAAEVSQVDIKIKQLEFQLQFKRSQQLNKLRRKVHSFLQQINFEVSAEDLDKIEDQIEIVLFLLDIFEEKFNEMTAERKQIDQIIAKLEESSIIVQPQAQKYKLQNENLMQRIKDLEIELNRIKNEDMRRLQIQLATKKQIGSVENSDVKMASRNQSLEKAHRRILDLEAQLKSLEQRYAVLQNNLDRARKQEARWKQRYKLMENQKDERIMMLEQSLNQQKHQ